MNHMKNSSSQELMRSVIQKVAVGPNRGRDISFDEAEKAMNAILQGQIDDVQTAVFLIALRMKSESLDECAGIFKAMQSSVSTIQAEVDELMCLADPFDGYVRHLPMSPFLPAVLAACGMPTLMHGVETVGPKHGVTACKVYKLAGINVEQDTSDVADSIASLGWGYLDQSQYANSLYSLNRLRDTIVKRTVITTLERLLMPIKAKNNTHFVLGYVHKAYPQIYASIAQLAGYDSALLLKGVEGGLTPALNKPLRRYYFDSDSFADTEFASAEEVEKHKQVIELELYKEAQVAAQQSSSQGKLAVEETLSLGLEVLAGVHCPARDSLCLAAGQILWAHNHADNLIQGVEKVSACLDEGKAKIMFNSVI